MEQKSHHVVPLNIYLKVFGALLVLTLITVGVAKPVSGFDAGFLNALIAMLIASIKAGLVAAFFMHLKYDKKLFTSILVVSVFFIVILFAFTWVDIISRVKVLNTL